MDFWLIFLTGLTTGGLTCLAIQGGLLATAITGTTVAVQPQPSRRRGRRAAPQTVTAIQPAQNLWPVVYFLAAKLVSHAIFGLLLGALGAATQLTAAAQGIMQLGVGLFMLATALNMLNVHPVFRYVVIQPPKSLTRLVRSQSRSHSIFAPALLGFMTVLIPCGTTQAMMVLAISTGSPLAGALVMLVFVLGTSPTFLVLGFLATRLRGQFQRLFATGAAVLILVLGLLSFNTGLNLLGSPLAVERVAAALFRANSYAAAPQVVNGVQELTINVHQVGYSPSYWRVESGLPLRLRLLTENTFSCALAFTIPSLGIQRTLPITGMEVIDLPPQPEGYLFFTCSMGMYSGTIEIEKGAA